MDLGHIYDRLEGIAFSRLGLQHRNQLVADVEAQMRLMTAAFAIPARMFADAAHSTTSSFDQLRASILQGVLKIRVPPPPPEVFRD